MDDRGFSFLLGRLGQISWFRKRNGVASHLFQIRNIQGGHTTRDEPQAAQRLGPPSREILERRDDEARAHISGDGSRDRLQLLVSASHGEPGDFCLTPACAAGLQGVRSVCSRDISSEIDPIPTVAAPASFYSIRQFLLGSKNPQSQ